MMGIGGIKKAKEVVVRENWKQVGQRGYRFERIDFNILVILRTR
jgi:hypothetical protein